MLFTGIHQGQMLILNQKLACMSISKFPITIVFFIPTYMIKTKRRVIEHDGAALTPVQQCTPSPDVQTDPVEASGASDVTVLSRGSVRHPWRWLARVCSPLQSTDVKSIYARVTMAFNRVLLHFRTEGQQSACDNISLFHAQTNGSPGCWLCTRPQNVASGNTKLKPQF